MKHPDLMTNLFSSALYDPPCLLDPFLQWMRHSSKDLGTQAGDKEEDDTEEEERFRRRRRRNRGISSMAELPAFPASPPVPPTQPDRKGDDFLNEARQSTRPASSKKKNGRKSD